MMKRIYWLAVSEYYFYKLTKQRDEIRRGVTPTSDRDWEQLHRFALKQAGYEKFSARADLYKEIR